MSAPSMGWSLSSLARRASAGGQLEHPSEVKSSTRTGLRLAWGAWAVAGAMVTTAERVAAMAIERNGNMRLTSPLLESLGKIKLHPRR